MDSLNNSSTPWDYAASPAPETSQSSTRNQINSGEQLSFSSTTARTPIRSRDTSNITANGCEVSDGEQVRTLNSIDALLNDSDLWEQFKQSFHYKIETTFNNKSDHTLKESLKKNITPFIDYFQTIQITIQPANSLLQSSLSSEPAASTIETAPLPVFLTSTGQAFPLQNNDNLSLVERDEELARALQEQLNREAENPGSSLDSQYPNTTARQLHRSTSEILATALTPEQLEEAREAQRQHNQQQNLNADRIAFSNTEAQKLAHSSDGIKHPANVTVHARIATFNGHEAVFESLGIPVIQLAINGLFWYSEPDRVKCFCCNNGLQSWNQGEDPAVEMAKWYLRNNTIQGNRTTSCRFVRAMFSDHETLSQLFIENNSNDIHRRGMLATLHGLAPGETWEQANARTLDLHAPRFANEPPSTSQEPRNIHGVEIIDPQPRNTSIADPLLNIEQQTPMEQRATLNKIKEKNNCKNPTCINEAVVALSCGHISACIACSNELEQKVLKDRKCFVCGKVSTFFQRTYRV